MQLQSQIVMRRSLLLIATLLTLIILTPSPLQAQEDPAAEPTYHTVQPGDTWLALSLRYQVSVEELRLANPHPNPLRQPTIGDTVRIPPTAAEPTTGRLLRSENGGLLQLAANLQVNPWQLEHHNGLAHLSRPLFGRALFVPGGESAPTEYPSGFHSLELSQIPARPGEALVLRALVGNVEQFNVRLGSAHFDSFVNHPHAVSVGGTGAFFTPGAPELTITSPGQPIWSQPWRIVPGTWDYDQVTLTGEAAAIDQAAIAAERERLFQIWSVRSEEPQWTTSFQLPINSFLGISSTFGARRSYNGGPYSTYHEGLDFSAYAGTPVYAPAAGTVVLAEMLYVRGGAVIIDHGLGIYSGFYHMSEVHAQPGQKVEAGTLLGQVGTTGLSSGNHLHWDLLVAETWVDAAAWRDQDLACWLLQGWGRPCPIP